MDTYSELLNQIFNQEQFLTLIVETNGTCLVGIMSQTVRDEHIRLPYSEINWSTVMPETCNEIISVFYEDDYRISKTSATDQDKKCQKQFLEENKTLFNSKATCMANDWDKMDNNCIIGHCAFVFDHSTKFTEEELWTVVDRYK
jgi:hypothetical protein